MSAASPSEKELEDRSRRWADVHRSRMLRVVDVLDARLRRVGKPDGLGRRLARLAALPFVVVLAAVELIRRRRARTRAAEG